MEPKTGQRRSRATAACLSCRKGRTRCVPAKGAGNKCTNCDQNETECIFDSHDGRKDRTAVKAETAALSRRIHQLEELLKQKLVQQETALQSPNSQAQTQPSEVAETDKYDFVFRGEKSQPDEITIEAPDGSPASTKLSSKSDAEVQMSVVKNLVPSPIRFDMSSGRVRYFGPTTSMNVLTTSSASEASEKRETHWPMCMVLKDLAIETHDYLMELYWTCHNSVLHLIHSDAFYHDMDSGGTGFYSVFLHLAVLATGFKYSDKTRQDIQRLATTGNAGSTIHEKAKVFAKLEQERPGGIPSIQAFGLLADIEFNIGRDDSGWLFAGMSLRLVSDVGLHVDPAALRLNEKETQIRHMVLWASLVHDMHWSLYLGRPTTLKLSDIAPACLSRDFTKLIFCRPSGHEKTLITRIYESLLKLMGLISPLCDRCTTSKSPKAAETYFRMASLDEELNSWHSELPEDLRWPPQQWGMPSSFYLLHTQYHAALILLHRPFVHYEPPTQSPNTSSGTNESKAHFTNLSRSICAENAGHIVEIFEKYRQHLDLSKVYSTGLAHAGAAATALMGEAIILVDKVRQAELASQLCSLSKSISLMSSIYPPGRFMASVVDGYIESIDPGPKQSVDPQTANGDRGYQYPQARPDLTGMGITAVGGREAARNPFSFTPTESASQSIQGLPFLPTSFVEGMAMQDILFSDSMGYSDYGFSWDANGSPA